MDALDAASGLAVPSRSNVRARARRPRRPRAATPSTCRGTRARSPTTRNGTSIPSIVERLRVRVSPATSATGSGSPPSSSSRRISPSGSVGVGVLPVHGRLERRRDRRRARRPARRRALVDPPPGMLRHLRRRDRAASTGASRSKLVRPRTSLAQAEERRGADRRAVRRDDDLRVDEEPERDARTRSREDEQEPRAAASRCAAR